MSLVSAAARLASCGGGCRGILLRASASVIGGGNGRGHSTLTAEEADAAENRVKSAHQVPY